MDKKKHEQQFDPFSILAGIGVSTVPLYRMFLYNLTFLNTLYLIEGCSLSSVYASYLFSLVARRRNDSSTSGCGFDSSAPSIIHCTHFDFCLSVISSSLLFFIIPSNSCDRT